MNEETNFFLENNINEIHMMFKNIINEMKEANIGYDYLKIQNEEIIYYENIMDYLNKMNYYIHEINEIKKENIDLKRYDYRLYVIYSSLYAVSLLYIKLFSEIFDTSKINDILKYAFGMIFGSLYIGLLGKDIQENRYGTKEKRDLLNKLMSMKEDYKKYYRMVMIDMDNILAINRHLWKSLDKSKIKKI